MAGCGETVREEIVPQYDLVITPRQDGTSAVEFLLARNRLRLCAVRLTRKSTGKKIFLSCNSLWVNSRITDNENVTEIEANGESFAFSKSIALKSEYLKSPYRPYREIPAEIDGPVAPTEYVWIARGCANTALIPDVWVVYTAQENGVVGKPLYFFMNHDDDRLWDLAVDFTTSPLTLYEVHQGDPDNGSALRDTYNIDFLNRSAKSCFTNGRPVIRADHKI